MEKRKVRRKKKLLKNVETGKIRDIMPSAVLSAREKVVRF